MPVSPPKNGAFLGAYCADPMAGSDSSPPKLDAFEALIDRKIKLVLFYRGWTEGYWPYKDPTRHEGYVAAGGRWPVITWGDNSVSIPDIISGRWDENIDTVAKRCKTFAKGMFLRPLWEMNGQWMNYNAGKYGQDASLYADAYRRTRNIFNQNGVTNVTWLWSPNWVSLPKDAWNAIENYYPGDTYVDWVGFSAYNWGTARSNTKWREFGDAANQVVSIYGGRKPIMLAEGASAEAGGSKASWINNMQTWVKANPNVDGLIWFNRDAQPTRDEPDWRVDSSSSSLTAFKDLGADAYFRAGI